MVQRRSPARERQLREFGENLVRWRKLQGLSAAQLAERAHITRDTLRSIERGEGTARQDSLFAVLTALGIVGTVVTSADPWQSTAGRALLDERLSMRR